MEIVDAVAETVTVMGKGGRRVAERYRDGAGQAGERRITSTQSTGYSSRDVAVWH